MNTLDNILSSLDNALRTLLATPHAARPSPTSRLPEATLEARERGHAAALMRVNHVGEICAQALYQGQALTARNPELKATLNAAAREEEDHLAWCERRIDELGGRKSLLNPLWYAGAFALGAASGLLGDRWNLGFLAETERQVEGHLAGHLGELPAHDAKSRAIVEQMQLDEARHAATAESHGASELPAPIKLAMRAAAKVMTTTAYWV